MPRGNSQPRGGGRGRGYNPRFGGRGYYQGGGMGRSKSAAAISTGPANQRAVNSLNQYYSDRFVKIKKDADTKGMKNQSFCYKRVICALAKYPMPILCVEQAQFLEGVGDTVAQRFSQMIAEREKEFEDGLFFGALAKEQHNESAMETQFAGIDLNCIDIDGEELQNMSLKQFLMEQDRLNFELRSGIIPQSKRRKLDQSGENTTLKKRMVNEGFLDIGTVSWSLLLATYFLSLHKGAAPAFSIENSEKYCMNYEGCMEMLQVLSHEFGDMIPLETSQDVMISQSPGSLAQMRENALIQCLPHAESSNPLMWQFTLTQKGSQRGKNLAKSVGLVAKLEVDLENKTEDNSPREKSANKVTINMYDKELMPVVDELYMNDQSMTLLQMKQEGRQEEVNSIFDAFIEEVENSIFEVIVGGVSCMPQMKEGNVEMIDEGQQASTSFQNTGVEQSMLLIGGDREQFEEAIEQNEGDEDFAQTQTQGNFQNYQNAFKPQNNYDVSEIPGDVKIEVLKKEEEPEVEQAKQELKYDMYNPELAEPYSEVILFVDNREKRNNQDGNYLFERLTKNGLHCELKSLPLGDFLWVLRFNNPAPEDSEGGQKKKGGRKKQSPYIHTDYVLDFITERKTADDLAASIMDGRYEEQKYRLKNCGINNVVYLVEGSPGQYCKIPEVVLKKAQIHTQIFHNFNVLRLATIQDSLRWLTQMTKEIIGKTDKMKESVDDFETRIAASLVEFKQFHSESGKNSNLTTQQIFARQLRTVRGLGVENIAAIVRVFKTPYLLRKAYMQCMENDKHIANLLNAGKLELMKNKTLFRDQIVMQREETGNITGDGHADLPKSVEDIDKIPLGNVVVSADPKLFPKLVNTFEKQGGVKMRKINKGQCKAVYNLLCSQNYISLM